MLTPFHIAFPVHNLDAARDFYVEVLGCRVGRTSEEWIDFDLFGHQVVAHLDSVNMQWPEQSALDTLDGDHAGTPAGRETDQPACTRGRGHQEGHHERQENDCAQRDQNPLSLQNEPQLDPCTHHRSGPIAR